MRFHLFRGFYPAVKTIRSPQTRHETFLTPCPERQCPKLLLHLGQENTCSCASTRFVPGSLPPGVVLTPKPAHTLMCIFRCQAVGKFIHWTLLMSRRSNCNRRKKKSTAQTARMLHVCAYTMRGLSADSISPLCTQRGAALWNCNISRSHNSNLPRT